MTLKDYINKELLTAEEEKLLIDELYKDPEEFLSDCSLNDISKNIIGSMTTDKLYNKVTIWAEKYNEELKNIVDRNPEYFKQILGIERDNVQKVRKDFAKYEDILPSISYMYNDMFEEDIKDIVQSQPTQYSGHYNCKKYLSIFLR